MKQNEVRVLMSASSSVGFASSKTYVRLIKYQPSVRLMKTISPKGSDSQSVTSELPVRRDGLNWAKRLIVVRIYNYSFLSQRGSLIPYPFCHEFVIDFIDPLLVSQQLFPNKSL